MATMSPLRRRIDQGYDDPQSVSLDPAILRLRGCEVQPSIQLSTGSVGHGGCPCTLTSAQVLTDGL
jgi:hypothetical protein